MPRSNKGGLWRGRPLVRGRRAAGNGGNDARGHEGEAGAQPDVPPSARICLFRFEKIVDSKEEFLSLILAVSRCAIEI
jgi:hypothetical protein